jgi:hypothetical protein
MQTSQSCSLQQQQLLLLLPHSHPNAAAGAALGTKAILRWHHHVVLAQCASVAIRFTAVLMHICC